MPSRRTGRRMFTLLQAFQAIRPGHLGGAAGPSPSASRAARHRRAHRLGGMAGDADARRAACEAALLGRPWSRGDGRRPAVEALAGDFTPLSDVRASAALSR